MLPSIRLPDFVDIERYERFTIEASDSDWQLRHATSKDYDKVLTVPFRLWYNDALIAVYVPRLDVVGWDTLDLRRALHAMEYDKDYRASGLKIESTTVGFMPRVTMRRDFCGAAAAARHWPGPHAEVCRWSLAAEAYYWAAAAELHAQHAGLTRDNVEKDYWMEGGIFTSGIINHNSQLHYHFDKGNYRRVWSAMLGFKEGITGGYLVLPEFRIAAQISDQSLLMFDGQAVFHGVTAIKKVAKGAHRYTIVYYSRQGMWNCDPPAVELSRIRKLKTRREHDRQYLEADPDWKPGKFKNRH